MNRRLIVFALCAICWGVSCTPYGRRRAICASREARCVYVVPTDAREKESERE